MNDLKIIVLFIFRVIICCLNGNHKEQINLGRANILFIAGFDKNVGKVINSFINEEF